MTREEAAYLVYHEPERAIDLLVALSEAVERLEARVAELERKIAQLTKDSSNSSKPLLRTVLRAKPGRELPSNPASAGPEDSPVTEARPERCLRWERLTK